MLEFQVLEGGRREQDGPEQVVALRMPKRLIEAIDGEVAKMNDKYPGVRVTRSSIVRFAIHNFVEKANESAHEATRKALGG